MYVRHDLIIEFLLMLLLPTKTEPFKHRSTIPLFKRISSARLPMVSTFLLIIFDWSLTIAMASRLVIPLIKSPSSLQKQPYERDLKRT